MEILLGFLANANSAIIGDNGGNDEGGNDGGKWESTFAAPVVIPAPMVIVLVAKNVNLVVIVILAIAIMVSVITSAAVIGVSFVSVIASLTYSSLPCKIVIV